MPGSDFIPGGDGPFLSFCNNLLNHMEAAPTSMGLTAEQVDGYSTTFNSFKTKLEVCQNPATSTTPARVEKNEARAVLEAETRKLVAIIQAFPGTTNSMRADMQLTLRGTERTPIGVPAHAPAMDVVSIRGRKIALRVHEVGSDSHGKPAGCAGVRVWWHPGETTPEDPLDWHQAVISTRTLVEIELPLETEPGTKIWLTAAWFNPRQQLGPAATAIFVHTNHEGEQVAA